MWLLSDIFKRRDVIFNSTRNGWSLKSNGEQLWFHYPIGIADNEEVLDCMIETASHWYALFQGVAHECECRTSMDIVELFSGLEDPLEETGVEVQFATCDEGSEQFTTFWTYKVPTGDTFYLAQEQTYCEMNYQSPYQTVVSLLDSIEANEKLQHCRQKLQARLDALPLCFA